MRRLAVSFGLILTTPAFAADPPPTDRSGPEIYAAICSMCHIQETPGLRAPSIEALRRLTPDNIRDALTIGAMMDIGNGLSDKEIENVTAFLSAPKQAGAPDKAN
jgi:cytochrome c553